MEKQQAHNWGKAIVENLSKDLQKDFPGVQEFYVRNLWNMRILYLAYKDDKKWLTKNTVCIILVAEENVIIEYIDEALKGAKYEIIDDEEPFYGEIPGIQGVWSTGKTLYECRENLKETLDEWLILSFKRSLPIPEINGINLNIKASA